MIHLRLNEDLEFVAPVVTKSTGESSRKYGPCEVCGKWASEVYLRRVDAAHGDYVFGHRDCISKDESEVVRARDSFCRRHHQ